MLTGARRMTVISNVFAVLGRDWDAYRFELQSLIDGGDHIAGIGSYHGRFRATGKDMQARVSHIWKLRGGEIVALGGADVTLWLHAVAAASLIVLPTKSAETPLP